MSKDDANIKLMRLIAELDDGEYEVNTSKGKFKVEKSSYRNYIMDDHEIHKNILITDEKGKKFSSYYFCHRWDYKWYDTTTEREIDYSNKFNLPYRYFIDCEVGKITIYQNEDHTKCYRIDNDYITNGEYETVAWIKDNTISDHLMEIDLNNFDRTIEINNKKVKISKDKDIEEELSKYNEEVNKLKEKIANNEYLKDIINENLCTFKFDKENLKFSDFKKKEEELLKLYKMYLEAMEIMNYRHDVNILREIVDGLNPEFHKLFRNTCKPKYASISTELDEELLKLKCGIYFIPFSKGLMQIDILPDNYCLRDTQTGELITEIETSTLSKIINKVKAIGQKQQLEEKEVEKQNIKEEINRLTRKLKMLESN